ncbi:PhzF family phenazine biosynthesis protein [Mobilicoccus massiliensis]|uniref:PhzF family phenazine biosynthesis protein n=1 Tax=Mobilicoccus massiliensis TaxID=1522310 RepID=UPI00058FE0C9|nr:PhzF family phenazine biosynthesis protein [Mobilicoccus massiliensis]
MDLTYRIINVFAKKDDPFSGNALCVFDDAGNMEDELMQQLAQQANLETVFIRESSPEGGRIRVFSAGGEGRFAGSATLGAAHVISCMYGNRREELHLTSRSVDDVTVAPEGKDNWMIRATGAEVRHLTSTPQILASLVGLRLESIHGEVMVVDSGRSGIVLPVKTPEDVRKAHLDARMLHSYAMLLNTEPQVYVWADSGDGQIESRMFYGPSGGVVEVAATGSGAANLGHWMAANGRHGRMRISQGAAVGRPSFTDLVVEESGEVFVGGHVNEIAHGHYVFELS